MGKSLAHFLLVGLSVVNFNLIDGVMCARPINNDRPFPSF